MKDTILKEFKSELRKALTIFEKESGGRHHRRPEISSAIDTLCQYIDQTQNAIVLLNALNNFISEHLCGWLKSLPFRDESQLKNRILAVLHKPEFHIQSLCLTLYQESESEKLMLYKLVSKLEERLRQVENESCSENEMSRNPENQKGFEALREKIKILEKDQKNTEEKISDLESEKWLKEREVIILSQKVDCLSKENKTQADHIVDLEAENAELKKKLAKAQLMQPETPEKALIAKSIPLLIYQNNLSIQTTHTTENAVATNTEKASCLIQ
jgi:hypothetical protein